jgi:hypothetical protein
MKTTVYLDTTDYRALKRIAAAPPATGCARS